MQSARGQKQLKHHFLTAAKGVAEPLVDTHLLFSGYTTVIPPFLGAFKSRGHAAFARCCFGV